MNTWIILILIGSLWIYIFSVQANDNIAFKKMTKQSSLYTNKDGKSYKQTDAQAAVDGHIYPVKLPENGDFVCTHTDDEDMTPWWAVNLGSLYSVSGITVYGRNDCCLHQVSKITIEVVRTTKCMCEQWEALETENATICHYQQEGVGLLNISCLPDTIGNFVRIWRDGEYMSICEVQVYGDKFDDGSKDNVQSACRINGTVYTGQTAVTTTARSNVECVLKCVTSGINCKVATYRRDSKRCIFTTQHCSNATTPSVNGDLTSNIYIIEEY